MTKLALSAQVLDTFYGVVSVFKAADDSFSPLFLFLCPSLLAKLD